MNDVKVQTILEENPDLRQFLFCRGFLVTDQPALPAEQFPFYGNWRHTELGGFHFWLHPQTGFHYAERHGAAAFLLGHAYDPFTMEIDEESILSRLLAHYGDSDFYDCADELTGVFVLGIIDGGRLLYLVDPSGMQSACSGMSGGFFYLSSHPQLVADLCDLPVDELAGRIMAYKWYGRVMGGYLPADLTPFAALKRIVPNIEYTFQSGRISHRRFYPLRELPECRSEEEYQQVIRSAADILKNNMTLVLRKWERPWLSLTGGIDSNTTFAAANGRYDRLHTFSYLSAEKEVRDVEAAEKISARFRVPWTLYRIPENADGLDRFAERAEIIDHSDGYAAHTPLHELRKRVVLQQECPADVEIKSWVSETIRAYWYKHYGRKTMPKLSAKLYRNLYKIFLTDRKLAHEIDRLFEAYIESYEYRKVPAQYPPADLHYNEVGWGSWGGLNISQMKYCFDITFIYNNRRFLDLLFRVPLEKRISDQHHLDMKKYLNPELFDMGIRVVNMKETRFRAFALNLIFTINGILP